MFFQFLLAFLLAVAYTGFWKGEGGMKFRKFEKNKVQNENCFTQNQSDFPFQNQLKTKNNNIKVFT